ncbi:sulfatase-like hydrolase/transferase [Lewinella sp. W8]|uniref:sulfatase-like hydrolase/transferase n=1 Tax=Lewinella sp. W8 TaxID=2528208 RepID=UPI0010676A86|nr:sulfatase-like hydrolase/transferase [Lewinella sp. W8]MTB52534.1 sulfatase-like hydrolase/transferase [Lewinella sp. W8]
MLKRLPLFLCVSFISIASFAQEQTPNVLLIIADDLGVDVMEGFGVDGDKPVTPTLDSLRASGIAFTNCWATPQCTPTRAAIMSGKYGIKTGVMRPPGLLEPELHTSIFNQIRNQSQLDYSMAAIGKWHIAGNNGDLDHPAETGVDHYEGVFNSGVDDYYDWTKVINGATEQVEEYATTHFTDAAIDWVAEQDKPWFLWLAHIAPHGPFHEPPAELYTSTPVNDNRSRYFAMIEAMDHEIGRLLRSMDAATRQNTLIVFVGDNGTPGGVNEFYPPGHSKGTIYEGGLRVPLIITGKDVGRVGEVEPSLVQATDLYATLMEVLDLQLPGGINNSLSLTPLLSCGDRELREINYSDYDDDGTLVWATRTGRYKLIEDEFGNQEFYDVVEDILEENNLIDDLSPEEEVVRDRLAAEAAIIRSGWSCNDGIRNGDELVIDDCDNDCAEVDILSTENIGCCEVPEEPSVLYEFVEDGARKIYSNNYPNHDFCHAATFPEPRYRLYELDLNPQFSGETTPLVQDNGRPARFFGVAMNGVILMPAPGLPFVFENPNTGEYNWDWVFEASNNQGDGMGRVGLDCASAHANNQGYHYHGNMFEYLETIEPGSSTTREIPEEPIHIGWGADGFPILYRFGPDEDGNMKEMLPSFQLRSGLRPGDGIEEPCGPYTGKYTRDYEYICGKGDLNECNGIEATVTLPTSQGEETFEYYYVITSTFPQIPRCLLGNVSEDFDNSAPTLTGLDRDGDGFLSDFDCDDTDPNVNPLAPEIEGNDIDENCDGQLTSVYDLTVAGITIGPNPNAGTFWIKTPRDQTFDLRLTTVNGQVIKERSGNGLLSFHGAPRGVHILTVWSAGKLVGTRKIVVQ